MARDTPTEREVTTDRESIEAWAADHDAVPVRRTRGDEEIVELIPESGLRGNHEELSWDEFHEELERNDMAVAYGADEGRPFDVRRHDDILSQSTGEGEDVRERLLAGETVTATITETTVIEQTIVEEATIESEVVDRSIVDTTIVDAELINRDVDNCTVTDVMADDELIDFDQLETGHQLEDTVSVEVKVDEDWTVTKEVLEQLTIESRIVDTDATETETVESETREENIDVEGVQETILESGMLESEATASEVIESGSIESEFREGDVIETTLLERKTVEEEVSLRKEFSGEVGNATTAASETIRSETVAAEIAADEELGTGMVQDETTAAEGTSVAEDDTTMTESTTTDTTTDTTADSGMDEPMTGEDPIPTEAEEGKTVVDATGEEVGLVVEVAESTVYVDPHPSLTDRIKAVLDWGDRDEETYPLDADHIDRITDDEVQLTVDEEPRT